MAHHIRQLLLRILASGARVGAAAVFIATALLISVMFSGLTGRWD